MQGSIYLVSVERLIISLFPLLIVMGIYWLWIKRPISLIYATDRMLGQLAAIGFVLTYIFGAEKPYLVLFALFIMMSSASWISLRPLKKRRKKYLFKAFISLGVVGLSLLAFVIFVIIRPRPWYLPTYIIPLAGMIFSNAMNVMSIAYERFFKEIDDGKSYIEARNTAWNTALIPVINTFFAVGLVSLPGMMTGQILAGVDPLIAVRYQILVMSILFGGGGLTSALFLTLIRDKSSEAIECA